MACFGAGIIWAEGTAIVTGGELINSGAKSSIKDSRVVFLCHCICVIGGGMVAGISE